MTIDLHKWTSADRESLMALCNAVDGTFLSDRLPSSRDEMAAVLVMFIWPFLAIDYQSVMRNSSHLSHDYWPFFWSFACLLISLSPISTALVINAIWLS